MDNFEEKLKSFIVEKGCSVSFSLSRYFLRWIQPTRIPSVPPAVSASPPSTTDAHYKDSLCVGLVDGEWTASRRLVDGLVDFVGVGIYKNLEVHLWFYDEKSIFSKTSNG